MTKRLFTTTVQLVIESESNDLATDAVRNILSDYEMADGVLKDWDYLKVGRQRLVPTRNYSLQPLPREAFRPQLDQVIQIYVASGVVTAVGNMPTDWDFQIIDEDDL